MKKTLIALFTAAIAATGFTTSAADGSPRLKTIKIVTTERVGLDESIYHLRMDTVLHVNDIESIVFDTQVQRLYVYGSYNITGLESDLTIYSQSYDLTQISGLEFSYLGADEIASPSICGTMQERNYARICWKPVAGAAGYEIRCVNSLKALESAPHIFDYNWDGENAYDASVKVGADENSCVIGPMDYNSTYYFSVRALSPKGEGYHSGWSTRTNFEGGWNYFSLATYDRGTVANVIKDITDRTFTGFTVQFDLTFNQADYNEAELADIQRNHQIGDDGKFIADMLLLINRDTKERTYYTLPENELNSGRYTVYGLPEGSRYFVTLVNSKIEFEPDAAYGSVAVNLLAQSKDPILLEGGDEANPVDLTEFFINYSDDPSIVDGQIYYLQGDRHYYITANPTISKGIRLMTDPADVENGKRAKFHLGNESVTPNFMLGTANGSSFDFVLIDNIVFKSIDFDVPGARNYVANGGNSGTGNYLFNTYSTTPDMVIYNFEFLDCTFQGFIRGFVRIQGNKALKFDHLTVDGCLFYNCGAYAANGNSYAWFAANTNNAAHNMFNDFSFTNNTIYDSPMAALIGGPTGNLGWGDDTHWNIRVENNTFINFNTLVSNRYFFSTRFVPGGSYFSFRRNLIALADPSVDRVLAQTGADIRQISGSGEFWFDVKDNYSVGCCDAHDRNDGIFSSAPFSATRLSFGMFPESNIGTAEDLVVKVGSTPLRATDLFTAPNNDPSAIHKAPADIFEALKYQNTQAVLTHEIFTHNIGDPRWRGDLKTDPDQPIVLPGGDEYSPKDLTDLLYGYASNNNISENQIYYLQGDKHYRINQNISVPKGIRLMTDPVDVENGKRAKFHLGNGFYSYIFTFGKSLEAGIEQTPLSIGEIIFKSIDFDAPGANNYVQAQTSGASVTGNYLFNMYSARPEMEIENFALLDCTFQGIIRGFVRIQGSTAVKFNHVTVDGCLMYNCGGYQSNGNSYPWFAANTTVATHNLFNDFRFTNNTIYDSPMVSLIGGPTGNLGWGDDTHWNIRVENNTFINFNTLASGRYFFSTRYVPGGSYYSFQRNLIVQTDASDDRELLLSGADIRQINGSGEFSFDVKGNYSVGCRESHLVDDGIFTGASFSYSKNSFGAFPECNNGTAEDLIVKVGSTPLRATDLFTAPNNDPAAIHKAPANILEALKYQNTDLVRTHEIFTLSIGDPRWKM